MTGGRGRILAVMAVAILGSAASAAAQFIPNNTPIQSVSVTPGTSSVTVGGQAFLKATALLTDVNASTRLLGGNGGAFWNVAFQPAIAVGVCGTGATSYSSQALPIDNAGVFHEVWSPSTPNTLKADGAFTLPTGIGGASLGGTLACVNGAAVGGLTAFWSGLHYDGTYSFGATNGVIEVTGLSWSSSNPAVATVDNRGKVVGVSPGQATITATYGSLCWQTTPEMPSCVGTVSGSAVVEITPPSGGGGGGNEPFMTAGPDRTLECSAPGTSPVTLEGAIFFTPEMPLTYTWTGPFGTASGLTPTVGLPLGANALTFTISDGTRSASDGVVITMQDTTDPAISAVIASPAQIWPPNHKMVPVTLSVSGTDACDASLACEIVDVTSSDGGTSDVAVTGPLSLDVRAERAGTGTGRTYTVTVECRDDAGNTARKSTTIVVPHNR